MKLTAYILCDDRSVKELKVDGTKGFFMFNQGIYCITNATTLAAKDRATNFNTKPESFYFEKNPIPITETERKGADFLEELVIENALSASGKPKSQFALNLVNDLISNPSKLLGVVVAIGIGLFLFRYVLLGAL